MNKIFWITLVTGMILLTGCGKKTPPLQEQDPTLPDWIYTPQVDNGLAESACVDAVGSMTMQRNRAASQARQQLASTLGVQVQGYLTDYQRAITTEEDGTSTGETFESVTRQVVNERLVGSRVVEAGHFTLEDKRQFCVLLAVSQPEVMEMVEAAQSAAGLEDDPLTQSQLRERYFSDQALQSLDRQLEQ